MCLHIVQTVVNQTKGAGMNLKKKKIMYPGHNSSQNQKQEIRHWLQHKEKDNSYFIHCDMVFMRIKCISQSNPHYYIL